jgi:hypothetical protein
MQTADSGANLTGHDSAPHMRHIRSLILLAAAASCFAGTAAAQPEQRPPKPYTPVAITPPAPSDDEKLATFRTEIAAVAKGRIYADLERLVLPQGFFWDRDYDHGFDPRKPAVDNLAVALALEHRNGIGWTRLAAFVAEAAVEPLESRPGIVCAPARPGYDSVAFAKLLDTTYTTGMDWAYPRATETPVRTAPQPGAAVAGALGRHFVQLLGFEGSGDDPGRNLWARIGTPDGKTGFVAPGALMSLTGARLCYTNDLIAGWRIAGYVGGGN